MCSAGSGTVLEVVPLLPWSLGTPLPECPHMSARPVQVHATVRRPQAIEHDDDGGVAALQRRSTDNYKAAVEGGVGVSKGVDVTTGTEEGGWCARRARVVCVPP